MTHVLEWQGRSFIAVSLIVMLSSLVFPPLDRSLQIALLVSMVLLMGAPHGALDPVYVRVFDGVSSARDWAVFGIFYVSLSCFVIIIWLVSPLMFVIAFLAISAVHFSGDPPPGVSSWTRMNYGLAVIALPALFHHQEVEEIFTMLVGPSDASIVGTGLSALARICFVGSVVSTMVEAKERVLVALEIASVFCLMIVTPPLIGFVVFFCGMHSARHFIKTISLIDGLTYKRAVQLAVWPMLAIASGGAIGLMVGSYASVDTLLIQEIFIGLAALTLPHMIVVERLRFGFQLPSKLRLKKVL